jgi:hypothetical protein
VENISWEEEKNSAINFLIYYKVLPLETLRVLGAVGKAMVQSTPKTYLESIAHSFQGALSHKNWSLRSYAMSSLVRFTSTIPAAHKTILHRY